jgi:hypothetical protein
LPPFPLRGCLAVDQKRPVGRRVRIRGLWLSVAVLGIPATAGAECVSQACNDELTTFVLTAAAYLIAALVLLVMLLRRKWRRAGLWALAVAVGLTVGVPLASQAWQALKLRAMEGREVVGTPPALADRAPLLIAATTGCLNDLCGAMLAARGARPSYVLPLAALIGTDLTRPVRLSDLPLEVWTETADEPRKPRMRVLTTEERQVAAAEIDYLVLSSLPSFFSKAGAIEAGLRLNPALAGMRDGELLRLAMAPLQPGASLSLPELRFDILDLWLVDEALALPLGPDSLQRVKNRTAGVEEAVKAICPTVDGEVDWFCRNALE